MIGIHGGGQGSSTLTPPRGGMQLRLASPQATFVNQGVASVDESDSYDIETLGGDLRNPI